MAGHMHRDCFRQSRCAHQSGSHLGRGSPNGKLVQCASVLGGAIFGRIRRRGSRLAGLSSALEGNTRSSCEACDFLQCSSNPKVSCELADGNYRDYLLNSCGLQLRQQISRPDRARSWLQPVVLGSLGVGDRTEPWRPHGLRHQPCARSCAADWRTLFFLLTGKADPIGDTRLFQSLGPLIGAALAAADH